MKQLQASEVPLSKVFSSDFDFKIPDYQRPYAWGVEETGQLLEDLSDALGRDEDEPYFLGSVVLVKDPSGPHVQRYSTRRAISSGGNGSAIPTQAEESASRIANL